MDERRQEVGTKNKVFLIVVLALAFTARLVFALSSYLGIDAILRSGAMLESTDEQAAIADAMADLSR